MKPQMKQMDEKHVRGKHETLMESHFYVDVGPDKKQPEFLWTENETNSLRLFGLKNYTSYTKDAFHRSTDQLQYCGFVYDVSAVMLAEGCGVGL